MDDETARRMDRLLARGKLSGPEADAILERVLDTLDREKPSKVRAITYWAGGALAAAAAVLLFINAPRDPGGVHTPESGDVSKSGLRVRCEGGELSACPVSGKLVFEVAGKKAAGFLSAYAEPIGRDEGERVFYYSKEDGSVAVPGGSAVRAIGSMKAGRYRVHAVTAERPLTREELVRAASGADAGRELRAKVQTEVVVIR